MEIATLKIFQHVFTSVGMITILLTGIAAPELRVIPDGKMKRNFALLMAFALVTLGDFFGHGLEFPLVNVINSLLTIVVAGGFAYWLGSRPWVRKLLLG